MSPYIMPGLKGAKVTLVRPINGYSLERMLEIVTEECGVTVSQIQGRRRDREIVEARQIICHIMVGRMRTTLSCAGKAALGGRDHTTVIYSLRKYRELYETDELFRGKADRIIDRFSI